MQNKLLNGKNQTFKEFKEFTKQDKERIASVVESSANEFLVAPIIDSYVFASSIALTYGDYFGEIDSRALWEMHPNKNHDYFDVSVIREEIPGRGIKRFETFRTAGLYLDHQSKNAENAVGLVFDVWDVDRDYEDMHLSLLIGVDKTKAPRVAKSLEDFPDRVATSMGCTIEMGTCTVCGEPDCDHLRFMRGGKVNGKKVAEFLHGVEFFEDSIVATPACHTAYVVDAISTILPGRILKIASQTDEGTTTLQIMKSIYDSIKTASTIQEKNRLSDNFDRLLMKLDALAETN